MLQFIKHKLDGKIRIWEDKTYLTLNKSNQMDGRIIILFFLVVYFGLIYCSHFFMPYDQFWRKLGVPTLLPSFLDLREVLAGFDCTRLGYDVFFHDPCGIQGGGNELGKGDINMAMPYPRAWWWFTFLGLSQTHTVYIGVILSFTFYFLFLAFVGRIGVFEGFVYSLILVSPPLMLLIERGNVDVLIFILVVVGLLSVNKFSKAISDFFLYGILMLVTFLKLFPFFGFVVVFREKGFKFYVFSICILIVLCGYYFLIHSELQVIQKYFSQNHLREKHSYGYKVIGICLNKFFNNPKMAHSFKLKFLFALWFPIVSAYIFFMIRCIYKLVSEGILLWKTRQLFTNKIFQHGSENCKMDAFRIGAGIYIGTFIMGWNYDYKLCFWLLTLPQLFMWIKQRQFLFGHSLIPIFAIVFSLYFSIATLSTGGLDELANWYLFGFFIIALFNTLPYWLFRKFIFSKNENL